MPTTIFTTDEVKHRFVESFVNGRKEDRSEGFQDWLNLENYQAAENVVGVVSDWSEENSAVAADRVETVDFQRGYDAAREEILAQLEDYLALYREGQKQG